jgi:hypothetical protein
VTPQAEAQAIIAGDLTFGDWSADPANVLAAIVGRAADARTRHPWTVEAMNANRLTAEHLTHLAAALVAAAANPYIQRGDVLEELVAHFGSGLP